MAMLLHNADAAPLASMLHLPPCSTLTADYSTEVHLPCCSFFTADSAPLLNSPGYFELARLELASLLWMDNH